jgi:hypothetical protein
MRPHTTTLQANLTENLAKLEANFKSVDERIAALSATLGKK